MNSPPVNRNRRVLVIDDNRAIQEDFRKSLGAPSGLDAALEGSEARIFGARPKLIGAEPAAFEIDDAAQGEEALKMVVRALAEGRPYAMAFVDVRMPPGWNGIETTKRIWEVCPDLQIVICTAYSDCSWSQMQEEINPRDRLLILKKPFDTIEVLQLANALTEKWRLLQESKTKLNSVEQMVTERTSELESSRIAALNIMEDALRSRRKTEEAYEDLKREVAERRKLEEQSREQASLLDKARDAIVVRGLDQHIAYWNKSAERLYGWTAKEALGRSAAELLHKDTTAFQQACEQVFRDGEWVGELEQTGKDDRRLIIEGRWTLVRDAGGQPQSILAINTDITEKKAMEKQFLRAQRMESIGRLASGVAHDLNNILGPILMSASLLRLSLGPEETEQIVAQIESSAQRGAQIVKQLLTLGRGVEGKRGVLQPKHLIKELIQIAKHTFPKSISIKQNVASDLWTVTGDATQLHQVLLNLSVNACDAMGEGGKLSIEAENVSLGETSAKHPEAKPGPYILIQVKDTGTGIPSEIKDKIFEPFFTTKEPGKGTGLGLATVAGIVRSHGGFIELESSPGQGTNFKIYLPATPKSRAPEIAKSAEQSPMGQGEMILVIDDELAFRETVTKILEHAVYQVVPAMDGTDGLAAFCKNQKLIRAVLCDLMMPGLDGVAVAQILKKLDPKVPILISSGLAEDPAQSQKVIELKSLGIKTFLMKPYRPNELLIALNDALQAD